MPANLQEQTEVNVFSTHPEFLDRLHDAVICTDLEGVVTDCNLAAEHVYGYPREELVGQSVAILYAPDQVSNLGTLIDEVLATGRSDGEFRNVTRSGREIWIILSVSLLSTPNGQPYGLIGFSIDISARKKAESALRKSRERYRTLFNSIDEGFCIIEKVEEKSGAALDFRYIEANPALAQQSGVSNVVGKTLREVLNDEADGWIAIFESIRATGQPMRFERELAISHRVLELYAFRLGNQHSNSVGVLFKDITQRRRVEEELRLTTDRFRLALRGSPVVVFSQDLDLRYTWIYNPALGYTPPDVIGKRDIDIFERLEDARVTEDIKAEAIRSGCTQRSEVTVRWQGVDRHYDLLVDPLLDSSGKIAGVTCAAIDVTERKQAQDVVIRTEKLATLGRLAATIAHEMNNPLEGVMNLIYLTRQTAGLPQSACDYLDTAITELDRVAHIARQSLGFYRETTTPSSTSVNAILESTVDLLKPKITAKRASIVKQWNGEVKIHAVAGELRQLFSNLLVNSLDAIPENGTIILRVSKGVAIEHGQLQARITIADNGTGIATDLKKQVFEPLFTTKGAIGTGLGLWVSKQIVERHGGTIRMRSSTKGNRRGTAFTVVLPAQNQLMP